MNNFLSNVLPQDSILEVRTSRAYNIAVAGSALLFVLGIAFGMHAFFIGHEHAYGNTREVPWGLLIAAYVFFVVTSTGLCLVSSIGHVFGVKAFQPIAKRSVFMAIMTIIAGFVVIGFEIENPWRMAIYNITSPNLTSNIWWMGTYLGFNPHPVFRPGDARVKIGFRHALRQDFTKGFQEGFLSPSQLLRERGRACLESPGAASRTRAGSLSIPASPLSVLSPT